MKPLFSLLTAALLISSASSVTADDNLPTVTIMGKTFYTYIAKKGESFFGIANHFGWDPEILAKTNKELDTPLSNGDLIYYPANNKKRNSHKINTAILAEDASINSERTDEPITVVTVSDIPVKLNPETDTEKDGFIIHEVQEDESLYGLANTYETTIEDMYKLNPDLTYEDPAPGETLRLKAGSRNDNAETKMVIEDHVSSLSTYKARRGDDWQKISEKFDVPVDLLKQSNPDIGKVKRGDLITIPDVESVEVERLVVNIDPRENSEEGRRELYEEVHSNSSKIYDLLGNIRPETISVAVVLSDPSSNKDMEFVRGALLAVNNMKEREFPTRFTVIDGTSSQQEVLSALDGFNPDLIISTAEKDLPGYITNYSNNNKAHLVNSFDVRDESYLDNAAVIQYLPPTSYFNEEVADYFASRYPGYNMIIAGKVEGSDTMGESIIKSWVAANGNMPEEIPADEIAETVLKEEDGRYLIYATPSAREDVRSILDKFNRLREVNPLAEIRVIGRPNWIIMADAMRQAFEDNSVLLPTRFYFNSDDYASKKFIEDYKNLFGHTPMKSYPVYSATSYDILSYLMPNMARTGKDFDKNFSDKATLQSPIAIEKISETGGLVNPCVYVVEFRPFGEIKKIILRPDEN